MDIRYSCNQKDFKRYTTEEIRKEFLIEKLFAEDQVTAVYSHVDRMVTLGVMPVNETVSIDKGIDIWHNFGTEYFLERRECGMFNVGGPGRVIADGKLYVLGYKDCLGCKGSVLRERGSRRSRKVLHCFRTGSLQL